MGATSQNINCDSGPCPSKIQLKLSCLRPGQTLVTWHAASEFDV